MVTENVNDISMEEMMGQVDATMVNIHKGDIVKGKVISVSDSEVMVNIGYITDGIISKNEISDEDVDLKETFKRDEEIHVYILDINDGEGNVLLSKKRADRVKVWDDIEKGFKDGEVFEIVVNEVIKGGVLTKFKGIRAFIPGSQLSISYVKDMNQFVGRTLNVKIIEVDKDKQKLVLSAKEVEKGLDFEKRKQLWDSLEKGQRRTGKVKKLVKFGAFIDIGGVDGLVHLSDLSWKRVLNPSEVVSVGDIVEVYVLDFDREKERISLGIKDVNKDPWSTILEKHKVNDVIEGTVLNLINFGAFVEIEPGVEGLVHLSEICEDNIAKPSDKLKVGDKVKVKILSINLDEKRMSLSIKDALDGIAEDFSKYVDEDENGVTLGDLFRDKFKDLV